MEGTRSCKGVNGVDRPELAVAGRKASNAAEGRNRYGGKKCTPFGTLVQMEAVSVPSWYSRVSKRESHHPTTSYLHVVSTTSYDMAGVR